MASKLGSETPKLNVQNVSAAVFGKDGGSSGSLSNIHGTISKLTGHVRKAVIRIGALEKRVDSQEQKTTKIINIIKTQKSNIGKKIPTGKDAGSSGSGNLEKTLAQTNKLLVQIQKELSKAFGTKRSEQKKEEDKLRRQQSKKKLQREESQLEKSSKRLGESVSGAAEGIVSPVGNFFQNIMEFLGLMILGIGSNFIFEWLKNPENMEKVTGWFDWIKEHWEWVAVGIGALALIPLIGAITGVLGPIGLAVGVISAAMMPLIGLLFNPLFWQALLIIGGGVLLYKAGEAAFKGMRNATTGGSEFSAAHDVLDDKLRKAGLDQDGKKRDKGAGWDFLGWAGTRKEVAMTEEEKKISAEVLTKRKQLNEMRDKMRGEIKNKHSEMDKGSGLSGMSSQDAVNKHNESKSGAEKEIRAKYSKDILNIVPELSIKSEPVEAKRMGGDVKSGHLYLVGDKFGDNRAEFFRPSVDGQIINSSNTNKMVDQRYRSITSRKRRRSGTNVQTLPPITNQLPPPQVELPSGPATSVPNISSADRSNPNRNKSMEIYGIYSNPFASV